MDINTLYYVFRKPNQGNYSIERIYQALFDNLSQKSGFPKSLHKIQLKRNYDILCFVNNFIISFFKSNFIVHITGACGYMVLAFPFKTRIFTIHDFYWYKKHAGIKGILYNLFYYRLPIIFSDKVVVVSAAIANEFNFFFPAYIYKIIIINNPMLVTKINFDKKTSYYGGSRPLKILQIGAQPLKNYERLILATKDLNVEYSFVHGTIDNIYSLIERYNIKEKSKVLSLISEEQLIEEYYNNDILFFASEAEGFGLPIIEALSIGLPVITSNIAPMNTIATGLILVNPFSIVEIRNAFLMILKNKIILKPTPETEKSLEKYDFQKVVSQYCSLYSNII